MPDLTLRDALQLAVAHHRAGRLSEAEPIYREIIERDPGQPDAWHLLGLLAGQAGHLQTGIDLIRRALSINPAVPAFHSNLGDLLRQAGNLPDALASCRRAIELQPGNAEAWNNLGNALLESGNLDEAIEAYRRASELQPSLPEIQYHLGNALTRAGQFGGAIDAYRYALRMAPENPELYNGLGNALREQCRLNEAITACRRALELRPRFPEALNNLGNALADSGQWGEAIACCQSAIEMEPNLASAHSNLGVCFSEIGRLDEAILEHRRALEISPSFAKAHANLARVLAAVGRLDESLATYDRALELQPCDPALGSDRLYALHYHPAFDAAALFREARRWQQRHGDRLKSEICLHRNDLSPSRILRLGYVSADLRDHVVGHQLAILLRSHDRSRVHVTCYATVLRPDATTAGLRSLSDEWQDITGLSDRDAADLIRADGIDILIDLGAHTAGNRLPLFARKPAPVQVTHLAYCGTTGLDHIDYRISDPYFDPPESDLSVYSEQTLRLSHSYWCYQPAGFTPDPSPPPALASGCVTFGCLNNFTKLSNPAFELWMEILAAVPGSRLLLHAPEGSARNRLLDSALRCGMDPSRIEFVGRQPWAGYLAALEGIDIALDPFPYGGGITTCDALWMGVPVVTLSGGTPVGRGGISILSNLGLPELIAASPREYLEIAVGLARDVSRLAALRSSLRSRMQGSPLRNETAHTNEIEAAFRTIWSQYCAGASEGLEKALESALVHHRAGKLAEAEAIYRQILEVQPAHPAALQFLGTLADQAGRHETAVALLRKAVAINPAVAGAYNNLGNALQSSGDVDDAVAAFREAIRLDAGNAIAHYNLGNALTLRGEIAEAMDAYRRACEINPGYPEAHGNLVFSRHFDPAADAQAILAEALRWDQCHAQPLRPRVQNRDHHPPPDRPLRIGYVSSDFREHVVGSNLLPVLREHAWNEFEIFCYSNVLHPDAVTAQFRALPIAWRDVSRLDDGAAVAVVQDDRIDILVDLNLFTAGNRLLLFARKPAPIQATYLGYAGTTGMEAIDYRISDPWLDPIGSDLSCYREETVRLPRSFWCYEPLGTAPPVTALPAAKNGYITFGCLNTYAKVSAPAFDLWLAILGAVAGSRLILHIPRGLARTAILRRAAEHDLSSDRFEFIAKQSWEDHIGTLQGMDIALDPFPYGGGITTCDALWMGVPVVTLSGRTAVGRGACSILSNIGSGELIARTPSEYIEIAVTLANDPSRLSNLRSELRPRMERSPLRDPKQHARDIEAAFRSMWDRRRMTLPGKVGECRE